MRVHRKPQGLQAGQGLRLSGHTQGGKVGNVINKGGQLALFGNRRIQLAQTAGRCIAGVGKGWQALGFAFFIQSQEGCFGHVAFPANLN